MALITLQTTGKQLSSSAGQEAEQLEGNKSARAQSPLSEPKYIHQLDDLVHAQFLQDRVAAACRLLGF